MENKSLATFYFQQFSKLNKVLLLITSLILLFISISSYQISFAAAFLYDSWKEAHSQRKVSKYFSKDNIKVPSATHPIDQYNVVEIDKLPHQGKYLFTEGLEYYQGFLYESTGKIEETALRKIDGQTGKLLQEIKTGSNSNPYFGEGITVINDKIVMLSYQDNKAFIFKLNALKNIELGTSRPRPHFKYQGEGWGLTKNKHYFIQSNGTDTLYFRRFNDFSIHHKIKVTLNEQSVRKINELEYVKNIIYANIFQKDYLLMINPHTGKVIGKIDASNLYCSKMTDHNDVLNGIAYNSDQDFFYLTGKNCPHIYKVRFKKINKK